MKEFKEYLEMALQGDYKKVATVGKMNIEKEIEDVDDWLFTVDDDAIVYKTGPRTITIDFSKSSDADKIKRNIGGIRAKIEDDILKKFNKTISRLSSNWAKDKISYNILFLEKK